MAPAYKAAVEQAAAEAIAYVRPLLEEVDAYHKQKLVEGGMTLIEYEPEFYESILTQDGVRALNERIEQRQINGLGELLEKELSE